MPDTNAHNVEYSAFGWIEPPVERLPSLTGEAQADVAIIGGGYTGMAAALRLAERGVDVALVEAAFCGRGASSRNAGHLTPTIAGDPQVLSTVYRRRAPELIRVADNAVQFAGDLISRLNIDCDYEQTGNVSAALTSGQLRRSRRIARFLRAAGGDVEFVDGVDWGLPRGFLGGILERAGGHLDPGKFVLGLREAMGKAGIRVYEDSPAFDIETGRGGATVRTRGGVLRAEKVLLASNAYSDAVAAAPNRVVVPVWVTLAETEPMDPERLTATGWGSRSGVYTQHLILEDYRPTARNSILMGTRMVQRLHGPLNDRTPDRRVVDDLLRGFRTRFPSFGDIGLRRAWGGWIAMTPSWLPVVGDATPSVSYAVGYNGHGLAQAPYLGTLMADRLAGDPIHDDLEVLWRTRPRFAPTPIFTAPALRLGWAFDRASDRLSGRHT